MFTETPEDQAILDWYDSQTEEFLFALPGNEDYGLTPRQAWQAFITPCPPPAHQRPGACLAAPAEAGQGEGTQFRPSMRTINPARAHADFLGQPITKGDWVTIDEAAPVQVLDLHDEGQFVYQNDSWQLITFFCCCVKKVCPPPAHQRPGACLAAPAEAGQGEGTHPQHGDSGFLVSFPGRDKGIDREAYRVAVLDLAALLCEEPKFFEELALRLRNVAADGLAEHRGQFDDLIQRCRADLVSLYGAESAQKVVCVHGRSLA